ncbi:hypothetical protein QJS10_CPB20g00791 [Acorus calamus]|uniref:Uncharacterized protein n=1 Tax=Acorus calamus TaxID=4465 RepID=A0AAV9CC90_ACOCL|nr:hypothetical protein QJS10_CPB20g00791 [Acorus calamus]
MEWWRGKSKGRGQGIEGVVGEIVINDCLIELVQLEILRYKVCDCELILLGRKHFAGVDTRIRISEGGYLGREGWEREQWEGKGICGRKM